MRALKIGVDATSWENPRGYGRFARNVIRRLVELDNTTTVRLYIDEVTAATADLPDGAEVRLVPLSQSAVEARADSSRRVVDLIRLARAVRRKEVDAFFFPSDYTYFPVIGVPTLVGVHDAIATELPELTLSPGRARFLWNVKRRFALARATRIFTVSEAARDAIADVLGIPPDTVAVVPEAPDPIFSPRPRETTDQELPKLGLAAGEPFFLFAGGISPHKNVETLIEAYARLDDLEPRPKLVIVGSLDGGPYLSSAVVIKEAIDRHGLGDSVVLPGFITDEALACLYSASTATVLPSLAEGFGLPAVEAAACGSPLVLSDLPAHRENLGSAALYFPARDVDGLAGQLRRVSEDEALRTDLGVRGQAAAARLSWDTAAERVHELLMGIAHKNGNGR
ncbi:MAG: hypothetical protein QOE13_2577 [Gaiellaceae bacterium]|jgi:glycosyltransferase involved in cell wall biosynthesis|nr:hypothetical protein [Gaiellaceae bacterium]